MQSKTVYIISDHFKEPKERVYGDYYTDPEILQDNIKQTRLFSDPNLARIVYKIECTDEQQYRLLEVLRHKEKVNLKNYDNVSYAKYTLNNYAESPEFIPLPTKEALGASKKSVTKQIDQDLSAAKRGDLASAKKVLKEHSGQIPINELASLIIQYRTNPEIFDSIDTWLQNHKLSLFSLALSNQDVAFTFLRTRLARKFLPLEIAELAETYHEVYLQAFNEQRLEADAIFTNIKSSGLAFRIANSEILTSLQSKMLHSQTEQKPKTEKYAEQPSGGINFEEAMQDWRKAVTFLKFNTSLKPDEAAIIITKHAVNHGFLQNVSYQVDQNYLFNVALNDPKAAVKFLQSQEVVNYLSPLQLARIAYQHRTNDIYKRAIEGIDNVLHPNASLHAILDRALQTSPHEQYPQVYNIIFGSQTLRDLYKTEDIIDERKKEKVTSGEIGFDPYQVLGVARGASDAEIKKAYYKLSKILHPDRLGEQTTYGDRFKHLNEAYEILSNEQKRADYDERHPVSPSHRGL